MLQSKMMILTAVVGRAIMPAAAFQVTVWSFYICWPGWGRRFRLPTAELQFAGSGTSSRQAAFAELFDLRIAAHNTGSVIDTMPSPYRGSPAGASS